MIHQSQGPTSSPGTQIQVLREELDTANKKVDRYVHLVASLSEELDDLRRSICYNCKRRSSWSSSFALAKPWHSIASSRQPQSASPSTNAKRSFNTSNPICSIAVPQNQQIPPCSPQTSSSATPRQPSTTPVFETQSKQPDWSVFHNTKIKQALHIDLDKTFKFTAAVHCVKFSPDSKYLAVGLSSSSGKTYIYDVEKGLSVCCIVDLYSKAVEPTVPCIQFSPDNKYIATASGKQIRLWDIGQKRTRAAFPSNSLSLCFSPNGRFLIAGEGGSVRIFSLRDGSSRALLANLVFSVTFSPDGRHIASMDFGSRLRLWNARTGQLLDAWNGCTSNGSLVAFTPDGKALVSVGESFRYWDVSSLADTEMGRDRVIDGSPGKRFQQIRKFDCYTSGVHVISLSPDYQWAAIGLENKVHIWDLHTAKWQCTLLGHSHVRTVDFSPCGKYVVIGGDRQVRLWRYKQV